MEVQGGRAGLCGRARRARARSRHQPRLTLAGGPPRLGGGSPRPVSLSTLAGTPSTAGDFALLVHGRLRGELATAHLVLPVIPDPDSLWQDVPSDPDARFARPDTYSVGLDAERRVLVDTALPGLLDASTGEPIAIGDSIALIEDRRLLFSCEEGGRVARVQIAAAAPDGAA